MATRAEIQERAVESARRVKAGVQRRGRELEQGFEAQVQARPLLLVGAALGAGFVAGGGLRATLAGPLMRLGGGLAWKLIVLPAITATLTRALGAVADGEQDAESEADSE